MHVTAIIPARYGSSRFPGKPMAKILGKTMLQWVYEASSMSKHVQRTIIATDDRRIKENADEFSAEVLLTSSLHKTGTDRICEVASKIDTDIVLNIQGDEPLLKPSIIDSLAEALVNEKGLQVSTVATELKSVAELENPNVVKVLVNSLGNAIYFSRLPVPFQKNNTQTFCSLRHVGIYAFRKNYLLKFANMPQSKLEIAEGLEQLRVLESGTNIKVIKTCHTLIGVDTPEDLEKVIVHLKSERS